MELRQLRTFEAVVRHRTVTDAAHALGLAPSSVSAQVRALEAALGVPLFVRGARGMEPTEAGERLRTWARTLLEQAERARRDVRGERAPLRLGALETLAGTHVPPVLARLAGRRPDLAVEVRPERSRAVLLDDVAGGRLDAALLLDTGDALGGLGFAAGDGSLAFVDVEPVPLALVAAPSHPLAGRPALTADDLRGERLLVNVPECSFWMAGTRALGPGLERIRAGGVPVMRAWAEHGLGISLLPRFAIADSLATGALVPLTLPVPDLSLRLVWQANTDHHPPIRALLYAAAHT
ncbi:LysR family transcriptional regulator [Streptomyces sp. NPDC049879]|uniref:LysR family transcriptional regulator n=1 Tax=Streptomyces sp. NPDC049879 TaxID=3365598 RepID=UPI0037B7B66D